MSHPLLTRQLRRLGLEGGQSPADRERWERLLAEVSATYHALGASPEVEETAAADDPGTRARGHAPPSAPVSGAEDRAAAEERDRLQMALGALGAGFLMMDETGAVVSANREAERLLGRGEPAMVGQDGRALLFGAGSEEARRPWHLRDGEVYRQESALACRADGRALSVSFAVSPVFADGALRGAGLVFQDVTARDEKEREVGQQRQELARARDNAEAASRAKSDFLASMSHEIRTPLNGILGLATLVLTEPLAPDQRMRVETIQQSGDSLLALINDVMDAARVESGRLTLICEPVDLVDLVAGTVDLFHATAAEKGLGLAYGALVGTPRFVVGDAGRVRQVLSNLIGNAVKFTEHGRVSVRLESGGGGVRLRISDTGIGIRPEARGRMFQMFSQEDATTTRRFGGSGLGLAISKELALLMNGEIDFESTVGEGSTFTLTLPVEPAQPGVEPALWPTILPPGSQLALCGLTGTLALQLEAFADATGCELVQPPFTGTVRPRLVAMAAGGEARAEHRDLLAGPWASVPRLILGATGETAASARTGGPPTLSAPVTLSPSRLLASVRHLLGMPGMPIRTRTFENVFERRTPRQLSILLVEDNPVNVLVAVGFLKRLGCVVDVAENGEVAIPRVCDGNYDLVLMDVHMPEVDGLEATRRIRRLAGDRMVRIVGISAATSPDEIQECLDAGMDGFLSKPLQPKALREALDAVARDIASLGKTAA